MSEKSLKSVLNVLFLRILVKFFGVLKIFLIANFVGINDRTYTFFKFSAFYYFFYYFSLSFFRAYFIPQRKEKSVTAGILTFFFIVFTLFSYLVFRIFNFSGVSIYITFFLLQSSFFIDTLLESEGEFFLKNFFDILGRISFFILFFLFYKTSGNLIAVFLLSEAIALIFKLSVTYKILKKVKFYKEFSLNREFFFIFLGSAVSHLRSLLFIYFIAEFLKKEFVPVFVYANVLTDGVISLIDNALSGPVLYFSKKKEKFFVNVYEFFPFFFYIFIFLYFNTGKFLKYFYFFNGEVYEKSVYYAKISVFYIPVFFLLIVAIRHFNNILENYFLLKTSFFSLVLNVFLFFVLKKYYGLYSVYIAKIISDFLFWLFIYKKTNYDNFKRIFSISKIFLILAFFVLILIEKEYFKSGFFVELSTLIIFLGFEYVRIFGNNKFKFGV